MQGQRRALMTDYHRPVDAPDRAPGRLQDDAGPLQHLDEAAGGAVQAGRLRTVQLDEAVIDAQARQSSEDMLDQRDVGGRVAQRGAALRARHPITACRDLHGRPQVAAHENDPGGWRGRMKAKAYRGPGQEAHAGQFARTGYGPLIAVAL